MGILDIFRRSETPPEQPAPGEGVKPPSRADDAVVTLDRALTLPAVYRAIAIWAAGVGQLTIDAYRDGSVLDIQPAVIRQPDLEISRSAFFQQTVVAMAGTGNAYWRLHRKDDGDPRSPVTTVVVLDPLLCEPSGATEGPERGTLAYGGKRLARHQWHHLPLLRVPGHVKGLGPIQAARSSLVGALDLQKYAKEWFGVGHIPPGVLNTDQPLGGDAAKAYKEAWYSGDPGEIKVLGQGLAFEPLLLNPADAQFLESQNFSVTEVARMFGVPAHLLLASVEGSSLTYQNITQADITFVRWTLSLVLREIEEAFTALLPRGQVARFNLDGVLRPDTKTRYETHQLGISSGFLTPNEVRAMEGLAPIEGGDTLVPKTTTSTTTTTGGVSP